MKIRTKTDHFCFQNFHQSLGRIQNRNQKPHMKNGNMKSTVHEEVESTQMIIAQAIRKSARGQAKRLLLTRGITARVESILKRLEGVFGNVATEESILQEFYTAFQKPEESLNSKGLRLEEILQKDFYKGHVKEEDKDGRLRQKFWRGLRSEKLKNATRVQFECITKFEMLRSAVRAEENEIKQASSTQCQTYENAE